MAEGAWSMELDEAALARLAAHLACSVRAGDLIALDGPLGAGKTTFARAMIRAMLHTPALEVPSPTFTLLQSYDGGRLHVAHLDLYRVRDASEVDELGLDEALACGIALVEWPERLDGHLPADRIEVRLASASTPQHRRVTITGHGAAARRIDRFAKARDFLTASGWEGATAQFLQGDASPRSYVRLQAPDGRSAVLMDAPRQPDGPVIRDGKPYSAIAHLAEDVRPFVAVGAALSTAGLSVPTLIASDLDAGLLLLEDLGDGVYAKALDSGVAMRDLWTAAVDALVHLRRTPFHSRLPLAGGGEHIVPAFDEPALMIELELLLDWYWPAVTGSLPREELRAEFVSLWREALAPIAETPPGWVIRDYHSPNLMWLPERAGHRRVGVLDFQDALAGHPAYDLVSLLQDARLTVPAELEAALLDRYCASVAADEQDFAASAFRRAYAVLGAQRNTKILGIFARLARRDGKPGYLAHVPRLWSYLARDLAHPDLARLQAWYDRHFDAGLRQRTPDSGRGPA
ncbi:MAG: tRNA (adenosine(37)-N6)-threonylcarbamoyltransferase complex ATPase subunit type 1 TsaE [Hyphomicrobiaceae bacterium]